MMIRTAKMLVLALILAVLSFGGLRAESYGDSGLSSVYNYERINAYKQVIRYYNQSITDETAERIAKSIIYYSYKYQIEDDRFVAAVITIESMFNPQAVSHSGAMGLGQLMPGTADGLAVNNAFNIEENVAGSCKYLKQQLDRYKYLPRQQRYELTLAAYNAGPGAVSRYGGIPPYEETRNYVANVIKVWRKFCGLNDGRNQRYASNSNYSSYSNRGSYPRRVNSNTYKPKKPVRMKITRKIVYTTIDESGLQTDL